jgi:hypothetical protein
MKKLLVILVCLMLVSCAPTAAQIQKAIEETQVAQTQTQASAATNTPTETPIPTATLTPTPDLRIINGDPQDFLIKVIDLPKESNYYLPNNTWTGRDSNNDIVNSWGVADAQAYIAQTGRVDGWWVDYERGSQIQTAPEELWCDVVKYKTTEGAQLSLTNYNDLMVPENKGVLTVANEKFPDLGEQSIAYYKTKTHDSGVVYIDYYIASFYYNFYFECDGYGPKDQVKPEFVDSVMNIILNKLKTAPLVAPE